MATKQTHPAPAGKNKFLNHAGGHQQATENGGFPRVSVKNPGKDLARNTAKDSAEYIAVLANQLQRMAETNGHEFLAYLIDMVVLEGLADCRSGGESSRNRRRWCWRLPDLERFPARRSQISETRFPG